MSDIIDFRKLKNFVKAASKATFERLQDKYKAETLTGYALCTDDGAMTIYHIASTRQWTEMDRNVEFEYLPVEWQYKDDDSLFHEAYDLIMERVDRQYNEDYEDKFQEVVDLTFDSFVSALQELRAEGVVPENVFLSVLSTDPSDHMLQLERTAIKKLNSSVLYSKWEAWNEKYN